MLSAYSPSEIYLFNGLLSGAGQWSVRLTSTGLLRLRDDAASVNRWTSGTAIGVNRLVRLELIGNGTAWVPQNVTF